MRTGDADSSNIHSNVPAFLVKLWKLVEDPQYDEHISWNKARLFENKDYLFYALQVISSLWSFLARSFVFTLSVYNLQYSLVSWNDFGILIVTSQNERDFLCMIKPLLRAKYFQSISSITTLQALFVSWICVSIFSATSTCTFEAFTFWVIGEHAICLAQRTL